MGPQGSAEASHLRVLLETLPRHSCHACIRICRRDSGDQPVGGLLPRLVWLGIHSLRDLPGRGWWCCWKLLRGSQGLVQLHAIDCDSWMVHLPSWLLLRLPLGTGG